MIPSFLGGIDLPTCISLLVCFPPAFSACSVIYGTISAKRYGNVLLVQLWVKRGVGYELFDASLVFNINRILYMYLSRCLLRWSALDFCLLRFPLLSALRLRAGVVGGEVGVVLDR